MFNQSAVHSILEYNGQLYAGGAITTAGGLTMNTGLAVWNGFAWSDGGLSATVLQMLVFNNELYAVGSFGIRKWQDTAWVNVGTGVNEGINATCVYNNEIYVGGGFDTAGGVPAYHMAKWNGNQWSAVGGGTDGSVTALAVYNNLLYVIGSFTQINGVTAVNNGAIWDGSTLSPMPGTNFIAPSAPVAVYHDTLYFWNSNGNVYRYANDSAKTVIQYSQINAEPLCFTTLFDKLYLGFENAGCGGSVAFVYDGVAVNSLTIGAQSCNGAGDCFGEYDCQLVATGMNVGNLNYFAREWNTPHAGFSANKIVVCENDTVTFTDTVCQGVTSRVWQFQGGSPAISTDENPVVVYSQSGTYQVSLIVTNPEGSDTTRVSNYISVTLTPALPTITQIANILVSSATSGNQWYRNDTLIPNDTTHLDTVSSNIGFYQCYKVIVSNGTTCTATSDTVCFSPTSVGIENISASDLTIYPNPAKSEIHIEYELTGASNTQTSIVDMLGAMMYRNEPVQESGRISRTIATKNFAAGIYTIQLKVNGNVVCKKICVE